MPLKLDKIDEELLVLLEENSKTRIHVLAKSLGVPPSTVHHRIKRLEKASVIKSWTIKKDFSLVGLRLKAHLLVFVDVTSLKHLKKSQESIAEEIRKIPGIQAVDIITGDADLLVSVRAKNMNEYRKLLLERIQLIEGITKTKTLMVIAEK